jgi:hypothetical protein
MPAPDPAVPYISIVVAAPLQTYFEKRFDGIAEVIVAESEKARNDAIRRARGEFILSTSADLEFSDELIEFLAARRLEKGRLYRIDLREGNLLHAREGSFTVTSDGLRENAVEDIAARDSGIHFGDGWFPAESDPETGEVFRWIGNAAEVIVQAPADGGALRIEVEPGPGVGPLPQELQVVAASGANLAAWTIAGRASLQLWVPPGRQAFRLSVPEGGRPLLDDLRILNFRFFRCDWLRFVPETPRHRGLMELRPTLTRLARSGGLGSLPGAIHLLRAVGNDVFGAGIQYWGTGWHRFEEAGTERFRWVATDAELVVRVAGGAQDLCLLVEPGPSLNGQPFHLLVRLKDGTTIGKVKVSGLSVVRVPIPLAAGSVAALLLSPDRQGEALPGDSRVLNFRVLACACELAERPVALETPQGWAAVTVGQKPVAARWEVRLEAEQRELAEIGRPAFLHVNACEFVLMDRGLWHDLRGLPETDYPPEYTNLLFCYAAHFAGATEEVLREPLRVRRTNSSRSPQPGTDEDLVWLITQMRRLHTPAILTLDTWGVK